MISKPISVFYFETALFITLSLNKLLFFRCWMFDYFVSDSCNDDTHNRAENIEEAIRQIGQGRNIQDGSLCHTT